MKSVAPISAKLFNFNALCTCPHRLCVYHLPPPPPPLLHHHRVGFYQAPCPHLKCWGAHICRTDGGMEH